jgi:hypothetical protein
LALSPKGQRLWLISGNFWELKEHKIRKERRISDFIAAFICLSAAAAGLCFFCRDLLRAMDQKTEAAGIVSVKENAVLRRPANRVLWDRLFVDSPVYSGDLIRTAGLSTAVLNLSGSHIGLAENTLMRIIAEEGAPQIELYSGELILKSGPEAVFLKTPFDGTGLFIAEMVPETALNAAVREEGMILRVMEGKILLSGGGQIREADAGSVLAFDARGSVPQPAVPRAVTNPRRNGRYLRSKSEPLNITFTWNRFNIDPEDLLKLEIAEDLNFTRIIKFIPAYDIAVTALDPGLWYWRLSYGKEVLDSGRITVKEASGPLLFSPAENQLFRYSGREPEIYFRWSPIEGTSQYILEVSKTRDFDVPQIVREAQGISLTCWGLEPGTWFWRVRPVFPFGYEGSPGVSSIASFQIEISAK